MIYFFQKRIIFFSFCTRSQISDKIASSHFQVIDTDLHNTKKYTPHTVARTTTGMN